MSDVQIVTLYKHQNDLLLARLVECAMGIACYCFTGTKQRNGELVSGQRRKHTFYVKKGHVLCEQTHFLPFTKEPCPIKSTKHKITIHMDVSGEQWHCLNDSDAEISFPVIKTCWIRLNAVFQLFGTNTKNKACGQWGAGATRRIVPKWNMDVRLSS